jgi:ketosteroid isomerase-like protein
VLRALFDDRALLEALREGKADLAAVYEPDAVIHFEGGFIPDIPVQSEGLEEIAAFWRSWLSAWEDVTFEFEEVHEKEDRVLAVMNQTHLGRGGIALSQRYAQLVTFRDRRVRRVLVTRDVDGAFAEAGIAR